MAAVIGALRVDLGLNSAAFTSGLGKARAGLAQFSNTMKQGALLAGAAATAIGASLGLAVKGTIDAADDMSKAAQKIGIPIEDLSRLKYAADLSGVSFEGLQSSVGRLSKSMVAAASGTGDVAKAYAAVGISVANSDGSLKSASQVMGELADVFAGMPDGAQKTALAMQLMGRSGADMIPMLNGGSAALNELMGEADSFGQVFTAEMGADAEAFNDNISRLQGSFASIVATITAGLLPQLSQLADFLVSVAATFTSLSPEVKNFITILGGLTIAFATLAVPLGVVAISVGAIGLPVVAVAAGIIALTAAVVAFWPEIAKLGEVIGGFVANQWAAFLQAWDAIGVKIDGVKVVVGGFATWIIDQFAALPGKMLELGGQIIAGLADGINAKWEEVKSGIANIPQGIADSFTGFFQIHSPSKLMHDIGGNVMQGLGDGMSSMAGGVTDIADNIASTIGQAFRGVVDGSKSVGEAISDVIGGLAQMFLSQGFQALSGMGGGIGAIGGFIGNLLGFASGGTILPGGSGGIDSQLVTFRKSPNERVDITKPGQTLSAGGGAPELHVTYQIDAKGAEIGVEQKILAAIKQNNKQLPNLMRDVQMRTG